MGIFAGKHYSLGVLPILLPGLKTHLVPWVQGGKTAMPIGDGRDYGQAMGLAAITDGLEGYHSFNIIGKSVPTVREIILFLHYEYGYPKPYFSVPFWAAYLFAWAMEILDPIVPWEPLIVRSIVYLLEDTHTDNNRAKETLGYQPQYEWQEAVQLQLSEMKKRETHYMSMAKPVT